MTYGTIVVCGGGCYGGYYVRQLARARAAGALTFERIVVVDRDADCAVARLARAIEHDDAPSIAAHGWRLRRADAGDDDTPVLDAAYRHLPITMLVSDWAPFFDRWLSAAIASPVAASRDAVVPSPLMPHLLADWVAARVDRHRRRSTVVRVALSAIPDTPWQRSAPDLAHYASFATWMCPINCIEPPRCPETRGPRDWTMPAAVRDAADRASAQGTPYDVVALFHTTHRAYGVGMFDVSDALSVDAALAASDARTPLRILVASVSHCHGAMAELLVGPPVTAA
ncbi:MAG: hypothetical protein V4813_01880 [Gemmatimonadota bacterium]